ncbi:substrate-binding periplasmic protein [Parachitinimonas caeni]|uniref:Transporter substrate-binding domain-containing protein n=1 Tax=Parachitinimonas caeni TaxID=3031301 RepID=A0ABT7DZW5_9NEIS|nr:transporter substrate-binding domain-containing protein [Parachitinimonas caeni]MDK2124182.1 transporter substrate-binding domain-containing protein [Parachitinimonas caeni]
MEPVRRRLLLGLLGGYLTGFRATAAVEAGWTVAGDISYPPYSFIDELGNPAGMDTEIVAAALRAINQPFEIRLYPWERVKKMLDAKQIDLAYQFVGTPERQAQYRLIGPIRPGITVFASRADHPIEYRKLEDLTPHVIGTVFGYAYTDAFDRAPLKKDNGATNPEQLLAKLLAGRVDLIVGDKAQFLYLARKRGAEQDLRILSQPLAVVPRYVGFPKDAVGKAERFAVGLKRITEDGTLARILARWQ